jgi:DNA topoisomerase-3
MKVPFVLMGKKLTDAQITTLLESNKTGIIKGFAIGGAKKNGILKFTSNFNIEFEEKEAKPAKTKTQKIAEDAICPKCKNGNVIKGKTAYGCSNWKSGCDFRLSFNS